MPEELLCKEPPASHMPGPALPKYHTTYVWDLHFRHRHNHGTHMEGIAQMSHSTYHGILICNLEHSHPKSGTAGQPQRASPRTTVHSASSVPGPFDTGSPMLLCDRCVSQAVSQMVLKTELHNVNTSTNGCRVSYQWCQQFLVWARERRHCGLEAESPWGHVRTYFRQVPHALTVGIKGLPYLTIFNKP